MAIVPERYKLGLWALSFCVSYRERARRKGARSRHERRLHVTELAFAQEQQRHGIVDVRIDGLKPRARHVAIAFFADDPCELQRKPEHVRALRFAVGHPL